ncbi:hypothetical protein GJ496_001610 [Pomphorhynchus laevis]|nr:hypothetical protein GJ496_001610 [Pomphorhynchus laevis]
MSVVAEASKSTQIDRTHHELEMIQAEVKHSQHSLQLMKQKDQNIINIIPVTKHHLILKEKMANLQSMIGFIDKPKFKELKSSPKLEEQVKKTSKEKFEFSTTSLVDSDKARNVRDINISELDLLRDRHYDSEKASIVLYRNDSDDKEWLDGIPISTTFSLLNEFLINLNLNRDTIL